MLRTNVKQSTRQGGSPPTHCHTRQQPCTRTCLTQDHSRLLALAPPALAQMFAAVYLLTQWVSDENLTAIVICGSDWSACVPCVPTQFPVAAGYSTWTPLVWEQIVAVNSTTGRRFALM